MRWLYKETKKDRYAAPVGAFLRAVRTVGMSTDTLLSLPPEEARLFIQNYFKKIKKFKLRHIWPC